jgi:dihydroorotase/N-acyl-D-amino-acid deacylase
LIADITIFDPKTIIDRATYEDPHQHPEGIEYVIVNGQLTVEKGKQTGVLAGGTLRKTPRKVA